MATRFSVSLMCMDFLDMRAQLQTLNHLADCYHVDIMDGHYCKNLTLSPVLVKAFARAATLPMDAHLMTTRPMDWIDALAEAGARILSPHAETINADAFRVLNHIERLGCQTGVVLNPATPLSYAAHYLDRIDVLTIMTVDVGYAGQKFIPQMLEKIEQAAELRAKRGYRYEIQIDGGCNAQTYRPLVDAGADMLVMGSTGLFDLHADVGTAWQAMRTSFEKAMR